MITSSKPAKTAADSRIRRRGAPFGGLQGARRWLPALVPGAALICILPLETQAQALAQAEPRLQPVRHAPLEEIYRPRATQRLLLPSSGFPTIEYSPELIGGLRGVVEKIQYPPSARDSGIEGVVLISFVVNEAGYVEQAAVVEGVGGGCDEEALRVVREARFKPGAKMKMLPDGNWVRRVVPMEMSIPITFILHDVARPELPQRHWTW